MRHYSTIARVCTGLFFAYGALQGENYRFAHFGSNDGLNLAVKHLVQDGVGFLWVGTSNGLFRYDGDRFRQFGAADGLPSAAIRGLHRANEGAIWVITARGLAHLVGDRFEQVDTGVTPDTLGTSLASDHLGQIFLATQHGSSLAAGIAPRDLCAFAP